MRYASIDIETTGLNPDTCQILEIGIVIDDLEQPINPIPPTLHLYIKHDLIVGEPYALNMNARIIKILAENKLPNIVPEFKAESLIQDFLWTHFPDKPTVAGKNFYGFDFRFINKVWKHLKFHHRAIDPASHFMRPDDETLPDLTTCLKRAEIQMHEGFQLHTAVDDAKAVIRLIRRG